MAAIIIKTARGMGRRRRMRIDFGGYRAHPLLNRGERDNDTPDLGGVWRGGERLRGAAELREGLNGVRLHPKCPCDNLNNCPGHQEGIGEVLCPKGLASTCWRSSVGRAPDL